MNGDESAVLSNKSMIFIVTAFVLACFFDYLFIWKVPGIGVLVFTALVGCSLVVLTLLLKRKLSRDVILLLLLAAFFSAMVAVRANILLTVLDILGTLLLLMLITEVNIRGAIKEFVPSEYLKVLGLPLAFLISLIDTITSIRLPFSKPVSSQSKQIIRGVLITTPTILLFVGLFAGADPVFHKMLSTIFNLHFPSSEHPYVILMVLAMICGALGYSFSNKSSIQSSVSQSKRPMGHIETSILLGSVNVLFVIFIALQATYFFGGAINVADDTFTYAEYARRGFFELIAISAFTYLIMLAVEKLIERNADQHSTAFKYLSTTLVAQVMVLMVFAFNRLSLYEAAFGFTTLRLYSHAFIVLLAVVYLFLLYKIFIDTRESAFALRTFFAIVVFIVGMNLLNPDAFIAQKNLDRYAATGRIDVWYLMGLSEDATAQKFAALQTSDNNIHGVIARSLYDEYVADASMRAPWQSWNHARNEERILTQQHLTELQVYKDYVANPPLVSGEESAN